MGRTKRKRTRKKASYVAACLDSDPSLIALVQWMKANYWHNETSLKLSLFENTGRGLAASKRIKKLDTLIEVPYDLMITFTTIENSFLKQALLLDPAKLKIHDLLSIYLAFEEHKGSKSKWKSYIASLPKSIPAVPWLCSVEEIQNLPEELRTVVEDKVRVFELSWKRSKESINTRWKCECCNIPGHSVLTLCSFTWAYVMVNTRGVYVDPDIVRGLSRYSSNSFGYVLSDDPCMALCPYLDMFNHSNKASTHAELVKVDEKWIFRLSSLLPVEKYTEIFISYGTHDNVKLLCEYGFFIPDDELDTIPLKFIEILSVGAISINQRQYKFIRERHLDQDLHVSVNGLSFNLKAVLFVVLNHAVADWCGNIFSDNYSEEDFVQMRKLAKRLVEFQIAEYSSELENILSNSSESASEYFTNVLNYLKYRLTFMQRMIICNFE